eukprot:7233955-Prymnesium_polylepis.1
MFSALDILRTTGGPTADDVATDTFKETTGLLEARGAVAPLVEGGRDTVLSWQEGTSLPKWSTRIKQIEHLFRRRRLDSRMR